MEWNDRIIAFEIESRNKISQTGVATGHCLKVDPNEPINMYLQTKNSAHVILERTKTVKYEIYGTEKYKQESKCENNRIVDIGYLRREKKNLRYNYKNRRWEMDDLVEADESRRELWNLARSAKIRRPFLFCSHE
ncbi:hypothetical protein HUJ05_003239 [Dendroctonus ponderosae]|nr:hypothetical protein HUJ05_003239 [Dendroctonus ponderosae]